MAVSARKLAEEMAAGLYSARGLANVPAAVREPLVAMLLPAAEITVQCRDRVEEFGARLDAYAAVQAELLVRDAAGRGELDGMPWPDVVLSEEYVRSLEWERLLGRGDGDR